jgi:hypothetical protein
MITDEIIKFSELKLANFKNFSDKYLNLRFLKEGNFSTNLSNLFLDIDYYEDINNYFKIFENLNYINEKDFIYIP